MSKNILGRGQGATLLVNKLELTDMTTQKVSGSRFENNYLDLLLEDTELASSKNINVNVNKGNLNAGSSVVIKDNTTEILDINTTSCDLKAGEYRVAGTALRDKNEELKNKTVNCSNNTITNVPNNALSTDVVLTTNDQQISGIKTFLNNFTAKQINSFDPNSNGISTIHLNSDDINIDAVHDVILESNTGNTTAKTIKFQDGNTLRFLIDGNGADLKVGEFKKNGTDLKSVAEVLTNKEITLPLITSLKTNSTATNNTINFPTGLSADCDVVLTAGSQNIGGSKSFSNTISADIDGNSATATTLLNTRTIAGKNFNGSQNVSISSSNLSNSSSITLNSASQILTNKEIRQPLFRGGGTYGPGSGFAHLYIFPGGNNNNDFRCYFRASVNGANSVSLISNQGFFSNIATTSDDRIKNNEKLIENATETLLKLKPQIYDKMRDMSGNELFCEESGLISQEVWYNAPELRHLVSCGDENQNPTEMDLSNVDIQNDPDYGSHGWSETEPSSLNYVGLIAYLIKSNQELHERIENLEETIMGLMD